MNRVLATTLSLAAAAGLCAARGPLGGGRPGSGLDMTRPRTVAGPVAAMSVGCGMEHPSIAVNGVRIRVAPVWHLLDQGFELRTGDPVSVTAVPSSAAGIPDLYAVRIANTATGLRIVLRDAAGVPVWAGGGGSHGASRTPPHRPPAAAPGIQAGGAPTAAAGAHEPAARQAAALVRSANEPAAFRLAAHEQTARVTAANQPTANQPTANQPAACETAALQPPLGPAAHSPRNAASATLVLRRADRSLVW